MASGCSNLRPYGRFLSQRSTALATCRCRLTFIATMPMQIASATRRSLPASAARWPRPRPACTLRRRCWTRLTAKGVEIARVTLHVGLGTFAPLRVERVDEVQSASRAVHVERGRRPMRSTAPCARAGALWPSAPPWCARWKHCALQAARGEFKPHSGETEIFISPGFEFRVVGALLTNFHLPQSSLLMLVSAFAGRERVLAAYRHAVESSTDSSATAIACSSLDAPSSVTWSRCCEVDE